MGVYLTQLDSPVTVNSVPVFKNALTGEMIDTPLLIDPDTGDISAESAVVGASLAISVINTDTTNTASNARFEAITVNGGGDPYIKFTVEGETDWSFGQDQSASNALVLAKSAALGTSNIFSISTTGNMTYSGGDIYLSRSANAAQVLFQIQNTSNTANSQTAINLITGGGSGGDAYIYFEGGTSFTFGYDNSAGNLAITSGTALGTSNLLTLSTAGALTLASGLIFSTAGSRITYKSGANAATGTATLVAGTVTVSTTAVTANSKISLTRASVGATGAAATGNLVVGTVTAGTSFVINSVQAADATALQATDVSTVNWVIDELV